MTGHDFSHLFETPSVVVETIAKGYPVTDETWLATIDRIRPPLVTGDHLALLKKRLDTSVERRGRPAKARPRVEDLIIKLAGIERRDVPQQFLQHLIERLRSGRAYTARDSDLDYRKRWWRFDRDRAIQVLYYDLKGLLVGDPAEVMHPNLGRLRVPRGNHSRSHKICLLINEWMRMSSIYDPPSPATIMKIVSTDLHGK